jgi:serine protease
MNLPCGPRASRRPSVAALAVLSGLVCLAPAFAQNAQTPTASEAPLAIAAINSSALPYQERFDRFIVKLRAPGGSRTTLTPATLQRLSALSGLPLVLERELAIGAQLLRVDNRTLSAIDAQSSMERMVASGEVEWIEPDALVRTELVPNDSNYAAQWHYFEPQAGMNLPGAWDLSTGAGVVVAVIDTGITPHSDLSANIVAGYDFISTASAARDGNGRDANPNDEGDWFTGVECGVAYNANSSWHGTHVAGTIAAVSRNALGVAGVAFGSKVQPVRALGKCGGALSDIADAIVWASGGTVAGVPANATPAKVINMSIGGGGTCGATYQAAIDAAVARGTTVVVAAGNSNQDAAAFRPANCANVVTVAAANRQGARASYSNYGAVIDVTAPGGQMDVLGSNGVLSTLNAGTTTQGAQTYAYYQGTSMATPHVAGLVALMRARVASLTPAQIEAALKANTRTLPGACAGGCGAGLVDAQKTLLAIGSGSGGGGTTAPIALANGVAVGGLGGAAASESYYTIAVPAFASNLQVALSGGSGNADLYLRLAGRPTTALFDCAPRLATNAETCSVAAPVAATYHIVVRGAAAFAAASLRASYTVGSAAPLLFTSTTDVAIRDMTTVESTLLVSGRGGNAPSAMRGTLDIVHGRRADLRVDLVGPNGTVINLHNRTGGGLANLNLAFTVNAATIPANGTWRMRVTDSASGNSGYIDAWSLQF